MRDLDTFFLPPVTRKGIIIPFFNSIINSFLQNVLEIAQI